jgi:hypothetical protein
MPNGVMISPNYWVIGERADNVFPVEIESSRTVGALKKLIKEEKRFEFDPINSVFKIEVHADDFNKTLTEVNVPSDVEHATELGPTYKLSKFFKHKPL